MECRVNEGAEGTVVCVLEYVEFAEARPAEAGSPGVLRLQERRCRELRRYERVDVRFDFGLTVRLDADLVHPVDLTGADRSASAG